MYAALQMGKKTVYVDSYVYVVQKSCLVISLLEYILFSSVKTVLFYSGKCLEV